MFASKSVSTKIALLASIETAPPWPWTAVFAEKTLAETLSDEPAAATIAPPDPALQLTNRLLDKATDVLSSVSNCVRS